MTIEEFKIGDKVKKPERGFRSGAPDRILTITGETKAQFHCACGQGRAKYYFRKKDNAWTDGSHSRAQKATPEDIEAWRLWNLKLKIEYLFGRGIAIKLTKEDVYTVWNVLKKYEQKS